MLGYFRMLPLFSNLPPPSPHAPPILTDFFMKYLSQRYTLCVNVVSKVYVINSQILNIVPGIGPRSPNVCSTN